ncbi:MAG: zinc-dependent alcohol dehydrogenase family protein [Chloroflexi bacterium]|nr:zinc-dependent alcohol dehydrogenase family protein [Chloroflexota bacterium]MBP7044265.1 zinc-dependent alcohol dehydrogenase family protein [Chloroflexota bacterium]
MKAVVYDGPGKIRLADTPLPLLLAPTDAIVRVTKTTICGTDLAILHGGVPTVVAGRIIGHEGVGVVEAVGKGVRHFRAGDRVLISCITSCGSCENCRRGIPSNCVDGGWILGNAIDGCQAEFVRVPLADNGLYHIPDAVPEEVALMLSDIVPTGLEVGVMAGNVQFGDVVAIVGAGPVGLAALLAVQFFSPAAVIVVDLDDFRLALAEKLGATHTINNADGQAAAKILALTNGRGVDAAIEAVGHPLTCKLVQEIIGVGGTIANIGVYSQSAELNKQALWTKNITIRMGVVNTTTIPLLLKTILGGKLDPGELITHRLPFTEILKAYEIFANAGQERAVKIVLNVAQRPLPTAHNEEELIELIVSRIMQQASAH